MMDAIVFGFYAGLGLIPFYYLLLTRHHWAYGSVRR